MTRAFAIDAVGEWDDAPEDQKAEVAERLQSGFNAMLSVAPKPEDV